MASISLYEAARLLDITYVRIHLEVRGADVNAQGGEYGNALQAASHEGSVEIVQLLLDKGADVNAQGGKYGNALQAAAAAAAATSYSAAASYRGSARIVQLLLDRGADVNAQGGKYGNALYAALESGNREIFKILLENGADANAQGGKYGNVLQAASYKGEKDIVRLLIDKGANINAQGGEYGNVPQEIDEQSASEPREPNDKTASVAQSRSAFPNLPSLVDQVLDAVSFYHNEPPIPEGMYRVRWVCDCGTKLFDDFEMKTLTSLRDLEAQLQAQHMDRNGRLMGLKHVASQIANEAWKLMLGITRQGRPASPPIANDPSSDTDGDKKERNQSQDVGLRLLLCVDTGNVETRLLQREIEVGEGQDDHQLFNHLRQICIEVQNRWLTLRSVNSLHLRRFRLDFSGYPETHRHEDRCQSACICLPPITMVGGAPDQYSCEPAPATVVSEPAIGSNRLTHYFKCRIAIRVGQRTILDQLPKRRGELVAQPQQEVLGWGIHFEEGWHWRTIYLIMVFFSLSSSVFGIAWSVARGDMGGAFTVSGWWMAVGAGLLGYLALRSQT